MQCVTQRAQYLAAHVAIGTSKPCVIGEAGHFVVEFGGSATWGYIAFVVGC